MSQMQLQIGSVSHVGVSQGNDGFTAVRRRGRKVDSPANSAKFQAGGSGK